MVHRKWSGGLFEGGVIMNNFALKNGWLIWGEKTYQKFIFQDYYYRLINGLEHVQKNFNYILGWQDWGIFEGVFTQGGNIC